MTGKRFELAKLELSTGHLEIGRPALLYTKEDAERIRNKVNFFTDKDYQWVILETDGTLISPPK